MTNTANHSHEAYYTKTNFISYRNWGGGGLLDVSKPAKRFHLMHVYPRDHTLKLSLIGFSRMSSALCHVYQNNHGFVNADILSHICLLESSSQPFKYRSSLVVGLSVTWQISIISKIKITYDIIEPVPSQRNRDDNIVNIS